MTEQPILVGMNNKLSSDPRLALWPYPPGCAGYRLWKMLHAVRPLNPAEYTRAFHRINLVWGPWDRSTAELRACIMREAFNDQPTRRHVVLLGREVAQCFHIVPDRIAKPIYESDATYYFLPHPSGRNLFYNTPENRELAGRLLDRLLRGRRVRSRTLIGVGVGKNSP